MPFDSHIEDIESHLAIAVQTDIRGMLFPWQIAVQIP